MASSSSSSSTSKQVQFNDEPDVAAAAATAAPSVGAQAVAAALALLESGSLTQHINSGALDDAVRALAHRKRHIQWERLPDKIIMLSYATKGDSRLELTPKGNEQAREAGARLAELVGDKGVFVACSPFERAQQTLYSMFEGGFPRQQVGVLHYDPRIREQEFGNFQSPGLSAAVRAEVASVGRFYYRRPNAESSADVFDRVSSFWDSLLSEGSSSLLLGRSLKFDTAVLVTHGLTIRLLLMAIFQWSVPTFESVYNIGNCEHVALRKNMKKLCYELAPELSYPPRIPWATRRVWLKLYCHTPKSDTLNKLQLLRNFRAQGNEAFAALAASKGHDNEPAPEPHNELDTMLAKASPTAPAPAGVAAGAAGAGGGAGVGAGAAHAGEGGSSSGGMKAGTPKAMAGWAARMSPQKMAQATAVAWEEIDKVIDQLQAECFRQCCVEYTVVDYLSLKPPRTMAHEQILKRLVPGHRVRGTPEELLAKAAETVVDPDNVGSFDWWGDSLSYCAKALHMRMDSRDLVAPNLDTTPGGRTQLVRGASTISTASTGTAATVTTSAESLEGDEDTDEDCESEAVVPAAMRSRTVDWHTHHRYSASSLSSRSLTALPGRAPRLQSNKSV